ncbi:MAG: hypothetical protein MUE40_05105 [Anaerolineae bacterium]|nr:hypothetical protein [Anaerolineae bacterium]
MKHPVSLQLSEDWYARLQAAAEQTHRSIESIVVDSLAWLFDAQPDITLQNLPHLTDVALWALVQRPLTYPVETRLRELTALSKLDALTAAEQQELSRLVERYDEYVLLRSRALLLLQERGHPIERDGQPGT